MSSVAIVGATGLVGSLFIELLKSRKFPVSDLHLFASDKSVGQKVKFGKKNYSVKKLSPGCFAGVEFAFFSSGDSISAEWAPEAMKAGATVIDNSAAFRMHPNNKLIVPEINGALLGSKRKAEIIANPNCSTIQLVMALKPLYDHFGISDVRVSTYQSVSGAGKAAFEELVSETKAVLAKKKFKTKEFVKPIAFNSIPQVGSIGDDGFCSEENKIIKETKKILDSDSFKISAFTVRVPSMNGHAEAVWVTLKKSVARSDVLGCLERMPGVKVHTGLNEFPTVRFNSDDFVHVGRIHADREHENTWMMWVVSDNLLKGAALNGIQIAEIFL
ncbi:MAG: aspartate-semialdehyde dehydrogenase [Proteobacteria bacterium SG_bin7]|nr:MAG: aspartate-semialdehyde dehydrogenase [Proteobacteria bacterium SG_bin7]